ncbi:MAG: hypothetical protein M1833_005564 [Piccolia ochrophora]|nr:MAG: hypothetical protein M1833_005564 [Piccolia ochrophora]
MGNHDLPNGTEEAAGFEALAADVRDQDDIERDVAEQAERVLVEQADEKDERRLQKIEAERAKLSAQQRKLSDRLSQPIGASTNSRVRAELESVQDKAAELDKDVLDIQQRISDRHENEGSSKASEQDSSMNQRQPHESQREFLIRTGKITPFSKVGGILNRSGSNLQDVMLDAEENTEEAPDSGPTPRVAEALSHQHLRRPGFAENGDSSDSAAEHSSTRPTKRRRLIRLSHDETQLPHRNQGRSEGTLDNARHSTTEQGSDDAFEPGLGNQELTGLGESDETLDASDATKDGMPTAAGTLKARPRRGNSEGMVPCNVPQREDLRALDDGKESVYQARLKTWVEQRSKARSKARGDVLASKTDARNDLPNEVSQQFLTDEDIKGNEWNMPHPTRADYQLEGGFRLPGDVHSSLFDYQKTGVEWLSELYTQQVGGIIGDEMGLGKTIQVISFLAALHYSQKLTQPVIVVAPATVMKQWVSEFHRWWPPLRVSILHTSGSGMLDVRGEDRMEQRIEEAYGRTAVGSSKARRGADKILRTVVENGHVLITTYAGLQTYGDLLIPVDWGYAILDEGHKIRNPNTAITIYCKELRTPNRIILSGTPMQNNLTELWSLFDFVFPMRLGTLVNFRNQFEFPIKIGGYANATNLQVQTAMKCAETLKDTISPYLLQRLKIDVASDLPKKTEKVIFCKMTRPQRQAYEAYLASDDVKAIMNGTLRSFSGIEKLRKICNHPDLIDREILSRKEGYNYGDPLKSGKMQVVSSLLQTWKGSGHKTLLFAQQRIVLNILEKFVKTMKNVVYRRMDGETPIEARQNLVDEFNRSPGIHVFLLTTKVGGLGVNLTGADRVIIFDPDWNPSTDTQARERAWRLGQTREVTIYRLMSHGTIEEKIYHRQLFKQFLANKILKDPKQRQAFPMKDLHDLFTLGSENFADGGTETGELFKGTETRLALGQVRQEGNSSHSARQDGNGQPDTAGVKGVAGMEDLVDPEEEEKRRTGDESRILEGILVGSGVHSTLEHDQIINGKKVIQGDPEMIEREAKRIAAEAAKELRKAGDAARTVPIGTPTWTGEYGVAGRPERLGMGRGVGRGGPSSAAVLAGLSSRQGVQSGGSNNSSRGSTPGRGTASGTAGPKGKELMKMIRDFIGTHGGEVRSQMLVNHFNHTCRTPQQTSEFKEMLHQIATLHRAGRMRGRWVLKDEFKT